MSAFRSLVVLIPFILPAISLADGEREIGKKAVPPDGEEPAFVSEDLTAPVKLVPGDHPNAVPFLGDVDGDGKLDLLVGEFQRENWREAGVKLYRNQGTNKQPDFKPFETLVTTSKVPASVPEFCNTGFGPQLVDFNADGILDLISGSKGGEVRVFDGRGKGKFSDARTIVFASKERYKSNQFQYNTRVFAHDWNRDGKLDLVVTNQASIWLFRNIGTTKEPAYAEAELLVEKDKTAKVYYSSACVADWDSDGLDDLVVGRMDGGVDWFRSLPLEAEAEAGKEEGVDAVRLGKGEPLVGPARSNRTGRRKFGEAFTPPKAPSQHVRIHVADVNGDGRPDLLLGDSFRDIVRREKLSQEERADLLAAKNRLSQVRMEFGRLEKKTADETEPARLKREALLADKKIESAVATHEVQCYRLTQYHRHGSVWLFTRKK